MSLMKDTLQTHKDDGTPIWLINSLHKYHYGRVVDVDDNNLILESSTMKYGSQNYHKITMTISSVISVQTDGINMHHVLQAIFDGPSSEECNNVDAEKEAKVSEDIPSNL